MKLPDSDPYLNWSGETIDDRRDRLPPVPLFSSVDAELPLDNGSDEGTSPQPVNDVGRPSEQVMVGDEDSDTRYGWPGASRSSNGYEVEWTMMVDGLDENNSHEEDVQNSSQDVRQDKKPK